MKLDIMVWNGMQYVRNTVPYIFDSLNVRTESVQIFIRPEVKVDDKKSKTST